MDPYSTPARRRRIIAVFAKSVLRQYCITACSRVARQRLERWAAIQMQCLFRRVLAVRLIKKLLFTRSNQAAIKLQNFVRLNLAKRYLKELRIDAYNRNAKLLTKKIEELHFAAKARVRKKIYLSNQRAKKISKLNSAAIEIQRVFRGMLGRRRYGRIKSQLERSTAAAISMQCKIRQFIAGKKLQALKRKMVATARIVALLIRWRRRRRVRRERGALVIQRFCKVLRWKLSRRITLLLKRREYEYFDQATELAMRLVVDWVISVGIPEPPEIAAAKQILAVHVEVAAGLFQQLHSDAGSPASVLQWCMHHSILQFRKDEIAEGEGLFTEGAALQQVVDSVKSTLSLRWEEGEGEGEGGDGTLSDEEDRNNEQLIILSKLEENDNERRAAEEDCIRSVLCHLRWGDIYEGKIFNGGVRLLLIRESNDQTVLKLLSYGEKYRRNRPSGRRRVSEFDLFEIFNPILVDLEINVVLKCRSTENEVDESDSKFRLNNALVFVSGNLTAGRLRYHDTVDTRDSSQASGEDVMDFLAEERRAESGEMGGDIEQPRRPTTAALQQVMRILVRERTPSPVIEYELFATIIQRAYRFRLAKIYFSARIIQAFIRRYNRFKKLVLLGWRQLVQAVISKFKRAILVIQCCIRRKLAMTMKIRLLQAKQLQEEKDKFSFGNDYGVNDLEGMWAAFGLQARGYADKNNNNNKKKNVLVAVDVEKINSSPALTQAQRESTPLQKGPPPAHSYPAFSAHRNPPNGNMNENLKSRRPSPANSNPVKDFLKIIQLPEPPPNCIRPDMHGVVYISGEQAISHTGQAAAMGARPCDQKYFDDFALNSDPISVSQFTSTLLTTSFKEIEQYYSNINGNTFSLLSKDHLDGDESILDEDSLGNVIFTSVDQEVISQDSVSITPLLEKISKLNFN